MMQKCPLIKFLKCVFLLMLLWEKVKLFHPIHDLLKLGEWQILVISFVFLDILFKLTIFKVLNHGRVIVRYVLLMVIDYKIEMKLYVGTLAPGEQTNISVDITQSNYFENNPFTMASIHLSWCTIWR